MKRRFFFFLLISVSASLLTGTISFLGIANLQPLWATLSVLSTMASIYGLYAQPNEKKFANNKMASAFNSLGLKCVGFMKFGRFIRNDADVIREEVYLLHNEYTSLSEKLSIEHKDYEFNNKLEITEKLDAILEKEGVIEKVQK